MEDKVTKIKDQLDALACAELRLIIRTRMDFIDDVYKIVGSPERITALENLIHLINELGFNVEEFSL